MLFIRLKKHLGRVKFHSKIKYPKFLLFIFSVVLAYFLVAELFYDPIHNALLSLGLLEVLLAGFLYHYAFSAPPAAVILLTLAPEYNLIYAGVWAGVGALVSDLIIFKFIRHGFGDEVEKLRKEKIIQYIKRKIPGSVQKGMFNTLAIVLIASPLPTEVGITLMASKKNLSSQKFSIIVFALHTAAIFAFLLIGSTI